MGNETLRVAMAAVGETAESLAGKVRVDPKTAGRWVSQGRIPHARTRLAVAKVLGREAAELWPEPFRRRDLPWFRKWAELEQAAISIRSYQPLLVPGLLQTEAYARAVLSTGGLLPPAEVERIVAGRLDRQAILDAEAPPRPVAVIDEVVLRRVVGDRAVMAGQVAHLAALTEREHVQVRVIPAENPWHTGLAGRSSSPVCPTGQSWLISTTSYAVRSSATRSTLLAWGAGGRASPARRCPAASRSS